eukprot:gene46793-66898_t
MPKVPAGGAGRDTVRRSDAGDDCGAPATPAGGGADAPPAKA